MIQDLLRPQHLMVIVTLLAFFALPVLFVLVLIFAPGRIGRWAGRVVRGFRETSRG